MQKNTVTGERMKGYLIEALFQLMERKPLGEITAGQIAARAGVDRSTYYRHFASKQEVLRCFLGRLLAAQQAEAARSAPPPDRRAALEQIFRFYLRYRRELLLLYDSGETALLLELIDRQLGDALPDSAPVDRQYDLAYHLGGVFSQLLLWLERRMRDDPAALAAHADAMLPPEFSPAAPRPYPYQRGA